MIAAMGENRVIGNKGELPWNMPADMAHFKSTTLGKPVIMGLTTYNSIGRPLPKRKNIVLSKSSGPIDGVEVVNSINAAVDAAGEAEEIMVIGGASIYKQFLPMADLIYLTVIHTNPKGDAFFPGLDGADWRIILREENHKDDQNEFDYAFLVYKRIRKD